MGDFFGVLMKVYLKLLVASVAGHLYSRFVGSAVFTISGGLHV